MRKAVSRAAHWAGVLYLLVIVCGLGGELALRGPLIDLSSAAASAAAILHAPTQFRLALAADLAMALADVGLGVLLHYMLQSVAPTLSLAALVFRLVQACVIAVNLLALHAVSLLLTLAPAQGVDAPTAHGLALVFLNIHSVGYDLGLVFFGINSILMAILLSRSGNFARIFSIGLASAGCVYLIGSVIKLFLPQWIEIFEPFYLITIIAETAFCIRLFLTRPTLKDA